MNTKLQSAGKMNSDKYSMNLPTKSGFKDFPEKMKTLKQWVCLVEVPDPNDPNVIFIGPINPVTGEFANIYDPENWSSFEMATLLPHLGVVKGVGFVHLVDKPLEAIDLEKYHYDETNRSVPLIKISPYYYEPDVRKNYRKNEKKTDIKCCNCDELIFRGDQVWVCGTTELGSVGGHIRTVNVTSMNFFCQKCFKGFILLHRFLKLLTPSVCLPSKVFGEPKKTTDADENITICGGCNANIGANDTRFIIGISLADLGWSHSHKEKTLKYVENISVVTLCGECGSTLDAEHISRVFTDEVKQCRLPIIKSV